MMFNVQRGEIDEVHAYVYALKYFKALHQSVLQDYNLITADLKVCLYAWILSVSELLLLVPPVCICQKKIDLLNKFDADHIYSQTSLDQACFESGTTIYITTASVQLIQPLFFTNQDLTHTDHTALHDHS